GWSVQNDYPVRAFLTFLTARPPLLPKFHHDHACVDPPQILIACAVIFFPESDARNATSEATSAGITISPKGTRDIACFLNSSTEIPCDAAPFFIPVSAISVSTQPGHKAFAVIFRGASSRASARVKPMRPVFAVQYAV